RRVTPHRLAQGRGDSLVVQSQGDLTHGVAAGDVIIEDAPDDGGLGLKHLGAGGGRRSAGESSVTVGHIPSNRFACSGPVEATPSVAFSDLGAFVLSYHPLHLSK